MKVQKKPRKSYKDEGIISTVFKNQAKYIQKPTRAILFPTHL